MRREPEFFGEAEMELVFMARRLREALKLEDLFTEAGVDYVVETGNYTGGLLFRRELTGAFFYVLPGDAVRARGVLIENRFKPYEGGGS
jgi:hypothetical protein